MLTVQEIMDLAKLRLNMLAISKNTDALIKLIYLGQSELYRKFNLSIKSETVETTSAIAMYELSNRDISLLLGVYDESGRELKQSDVVDGLAWDIKFINYKAFILREPKDELLYAVYKASPIVLKEVDDYVELPDAMIDALLCYVCYMAHGSIHSSASVTNARSGSTESDVYYQRFTAACTELEMQGYKIPLNSESLPTIARGLK